MPGKVNSLYWIMKYPVMVIPTPVIKLAKTPALVVLFQKRPYMKGPRKDPDRQPHDHDINEVMGLLGRSAIATENPRNTTINMRIIRTCVLLDMFLANPLLIKSIVRVALDDITTAESVDIEAESTSIITTATKNVGN